MKKSVESVEPESASAEPFVSNEPTSPAPTPPPTPNEPSISLDDFCRLLSATDRRVALIGGFHLTMRIAQREQDTETAYRAAFHQFAHA